MGARGFLESCKGVFETAIRSENSPFFIHDCCSGLGMSTGNSPSEVTAPNPSPRGQILPHPRPREGSRGELLPHPRPRSGIKSPRGSPSPHQLYKQQQITYINNNKYPIIHMQITVFIIAYCIVHNNTETITLFIHSPQVIHQLEIATKNPNIEHRFIIIGSPRKTGTGEAHQTRPRETRRGQILPHLAPRGERFCPKPITK